MIIFYYRLLKFLGFFKKILFIGTYIAGERFVLFLSGGISGSKKTIKLGDNVTLSGWLISDGGIIKIGNDTVINEGVMIRSMNSITIGSHCEIGSDTYIQDHNSMSLDFKKRRSMSGKILNKPIVIGSDVWIGRRATILKGVTIGDQAIVATQAVVTKNVPKATIVAGNPAKIVKRLRYEK